MKMHLAGKTDQAKADLARLAIIRKQREEAARKKEEERKGKSPAFVNVVEQLVKMSRWKSEIHYCILLSLQQKKQRRRQQQRLKDYIRCLSNNPNSGFLEVLMHLWTVYDDIDNVIFEDKAKHNVGCYNTAIH